MCMCDNNLVQCGSILPLRRHLGYELSLVNVTTLWFRALVSCDIHHHHHQPTTKESDQDLRVWVQVQQTFFSQSIRQEPGLEEPLHDDDDDDDDMMS